MSPLAIRRQIQLDRRRNTTLAALVLTTQRAGHQLLHSGRDRGPRWLAYKAVDAVLLRVVASCEIPASTSIGQNVKLEHAARGVVLSSTAVIEDDVTIYHDVTVAWKSRVGRGTTLYPGTRVLHSTTVGAGCTIGANAVVTRDIPPGSTAAGAPARVLHLMIELPGAGTPPPATADATPPRPIPTIR